MQLLWGDMEGWLQRSSMLAIVEFYLTEHWLQLNLCQVDSQIDVGVTQMTKFSSNRPVESVMTAGQSLVKWTFLSFNVTANGSVWLLFTVDIEEFLQWSYLIIAGKNKSSSKRNLDYGCHAVTNISGKLPTILDFLNTYSPRCWYADYYWFILIAKAWIPVLRNLYQLLDKLHRQYWTLSIHAFIP